MFVWAERRGLNRIAGVVAASVFMFGGAGFSHIYAGHLTMIDAIAWIPLVLLAVDGAIENASGFAWTWMLVGMFAIAMQILTGHPQTVFNTGIASAIYLALRLIEDRSRWRAAIVYGASYAGGVALSAVQLAAAAHAGAESTRGGAGFPIEMAGFFSFPPENLLTLIAPWFFGSSSNDMSSLYWGRCYFWEMQLFIGVTGIMLAVYGAICGERRARKFCAALAVIILIMAMGKHTPLFKIMYSLVPGFDRFRGHSKFIAVAAPFLAMLAGAGADRLIKQARVGTGWIVALAVLGIGSVVVAISIHASSSSGTGWWATKLMQIVQTGESYVPAQTLASPEFIKQSASGASRGLWIAAATFAILASLVYAIRIHRGAAYGVAAFAVFEVFIFARMIRPVFDLSEAMHPGFIRDFKSKTSGDFRVMHPAGNNNILMSSGISSIWGYDPHVNRRYAEFMAASQGQNPNDATSSVDFQKVHSLFKMLRCRYVFLPDDNELSVRDIGETAPHAYLVSACQIIKERDPILAAMMTPEFNPSAQVILESAPNPMPEANPNLDPGAVEIIKRDSDSLSINAVVSRPSLLIVTDTYSEGWKARSSAGFPDRHYQVLPANYILRCIPLEMGQHHIEMYFEPPGYVAGIWITILAWIGFFILAVWRGIVGFRSSRKAQPLTTTL